ncbi:MAG: hypothetical protein M3Q23_15330, partial [Actinomycetota bacterium]|nr:hypothetical protein [Actinomycetota bacterium]
SGAARAGGPTGRLRVRARAMRRQARERRLTLPTVLVVVGSASSGREEIVSLLGESPGLRVAGSPEFLPGLCRWFPNMERLVGSVVRPRANESAALHVRRMLKDVLESGPPGVPVLPLEPSADAAGHVEASTIVPTLLTEAVFLLVARHPVDEFAAARAGRESLTADAFALEWAGAVREWLGVALRRPRDSFVLVRGARFGIQHERLDPGRAILLGARRPRTLPLVHWIAFPELGHELGPVLERVGLPAGSVAAVEFADLGPHSGRQPSAEERRRIVEVCGREMMALRMLTGSDFQDVVPYMDPRDEPDRPGIDRG